MAWDFENRAAVSFGGTPTEVVYDGFAVWVFSSSGYTVFSLNDATLDLYHDSNRFFDDGPSVASSAAYVSVPPINEWAIGESYTKYQYIKNGSYKFVCLQPHTATADDEPAIVDGGVNQADYWYYPGLGYDSACTWNSIVYALRHVNDWNKNTVYSADDFIVDHSTNYIYACDVPHTSTPVTEPGVGASWTAYWTRSETILLEPILDYGSVITVLSVNDPNNPTVIKCPAQMKSKIAAANGKLWMVSSKVDANDRQTLYTYEIATDTWTSQAIPGRRQLTDPRDIIDGLDGSIYITDANEHGIHEYDHVTNAYVAFHRINRHPYRLSVNQSKTVYVTSDASSLYNGGMVNTFNQTTNAVASFCGAGGDHDVLCDDERAGYVWMIGRQAGLMRVNKTSKDVKVMNTGVLCWTLQPSDTLANSGSTIAADAFTQSWGEGTAYSAGAKVKSPVDGNVYEYSLTDNAPYVSTWYDVPGVPDNAAMSLYWRSADALTVDTMPSSTVKLMRDYPVVTGLLIPSRTYEQWNGAGFDTVTVPDHLVVASAGKIWLVRTSALFRNNTTEVLGTALISIGLQDFIGDF